MRRDSKSGNIRAVFCSPPILRVVAGQSQSRDGENGRMTLISRAKIRDMKTHRSHNRGCRCEGSVRHGQKALHQCITCLRQHTTAFSSEYIWLRYSEEIRSSSVGSSRGVTADRKVEYLLSSELAELMQDLTHCKTDSD